MDMRKLEELKEKLMRELDMVSGKQQMTLADISMIDTLTHAIKNLCKIIEGEEGYSNDGYSERHYVRGHYSRDGGGSYGRGRSYGRGGSYGGRSYRDMLEEEYSNAMDPKEREVIQRMMDRM